MMKTDVLTVGPIETNCYLVSLEDRDDALIIDPGAEGSRIRAALKGKKAFCVVDRSVSFGWNCGSMYVETLAHRADL